jgi:L-aminopeptidase/D-esterase-like protein
MGSVGAGAGATVGKLFGPQRAMKGGIGTASLMLDGITVAALVAVNAVGDVIDPATGQVVAGARGGDGRPMNSMAALKAGQTPARLVSGANTTIGVVATDARLDKAQATKLAQMSHDGLARAINPVHTPSDGDVMFALATGRHDRGGRSVDLSWLGALAAEVTAQAILNAISMATGLPGLPAAGELG